MRKTFLALLLSAIAVCAHDHIEVGVDPDDGARLGLDGPGFQLACYVPRGEFFSGNTPAFPGGYHACELTFTTEVNALDQAVGADPRIEILSVTGPVGGLFAFWEVGAAAPVWSRTSGWTGASAAFSAAYNGDTHVHGRVFTMDRSGIYSVTFRAVDAAGKFGPSTNKTITFNAQQPPQLAIAVHGANAHLSFTSRPNLVYDLQNCTDLSSGRWTNVGPFAFMDGHGGATNVTVTNAVVPGPAVFYRLVEYY